MHLYFWKHLFALNIFKLGLRIFQVPDSARDVGHVVEGAVKIAKGLDGCIDRVLVCLSLSLGMLLGNEVWTESERLRGIIHASF